MGYCAKCGAEITDEPICLNCGCETGLGNKEEKIKNKKQVNVKKVVLLITIVLVAVVAIIAGLSVWNHIRVAQVKEQLAGNKYEYSYSGYFTAEYSYFKFDEEANCTYGYWFSHMDERVDYERTYEIKFEDGMVFFVCGIDTYEIRYDRYGNIEGLYDINTKELYE